MLPDKPDGLIFEGHAFGERIVLVKSEGQIQLYFASSPAISADIEMSGVMSRIDPNTPLKLLGVYTQAMMLALCWRPDPKRVYMLGFGGGRIPLVLRHYFPECIIDGSEINAEVLNIARQYFGIKEDDRMHIAVEDGRAWLGKTPVNQRYDIILVDCFTGKGNHPYRLSTIEFYNLCKSRLVEGGMVATNLLEDDSLFEQKLSTFAASFGNVVDFEHHGAHVLFGSENAIDPTEITTRALELNLKYSFEFPFAEHARHITKMSAGPSIRNKESLIDRDEKLHANNLRLDQDPMSRKSGRNDPCPCGSGKKFKKCHGG
jgi:spermidine synthase